MPFYVGKGKGDRLYSHEAEARRGSGHPKCVRIREIWAAGLVVWKQIIEHFKTEKAAFAFESRRIAEIGPERLTNIIRGGESLGAIKNDVDWVRAIRVLVIKFPELKGPAWFSVPGVGFSHPVPESLFESVRNRLKDITERRGWDWVEGVFTASNVEAARWRRGSKQAAG